MFSSYFYLVTLGCFRKCAIVFFCRGKVWLFIKKMLGKTPNRCWKELQPLKCTQHHQLSSLKLRMLSGSLNWQVSTGGRGHQGQYLWTGKQGWWSPSWRKGTRGCTATTGSSHSSAHLLTYFLGFSRICLIQEEQCGFCPGCGPGSGPAWMEQKT